MKSKKNPSKELFLHCVMIGLAAISFLLGAVSFPAFAAIRGNGTDIIDTVVGLPGISGYAGNGGLATAAKTAGPGEIVFDKDGNYYFSDITNSVLCKVDAATGVITTYAGTGALNYTGDGGPATSATFDWINGLAIDDDGNLYISDTISGVIRKVDVATGIITTFAGTGTLSHTGDGGLALNADIDGPYGLAFGPDGDLYFSEYMGHTIRKIDMNTLKISLVAGTYVDEFFNQGGYSGDGGAAVDAELSYPCDIAFDGDKNLYFCDYNNNVVRKVDTSGKITTYAGTGYGAGNPINFNNVTNAYSGDGGQATAARLFGPRGLAFDRSGNLYISDTDNNVIRKVDTAGVITTVVGTGKFAGELNDDIIDYGGAFSGDGGASGKAELWGPRGIAFDSSGNLYLSDTMNFVIRKMAAKNTSPDAIDDTAESALNTPVTIKVLSNDSDPDGDTLTVPEAKNPAHGSVAINSDGTITYTPNPGFSGTDTFTYTIEDGYGGTDIATVTVNVTGKLDTVDHFAYIIGYPDGKVRPEGNISRAEVATIFFRLMTDNYRASVWKNTNNYSDVTVNQWYNNAASTLSNANILHGYPNGTFGGNRFITRAEFAAIAARFVNGTYDGADKFSDINGHWAANDINLAAQLGWVDGYPDGTFKPDNPITRAEAMTLVNRVLGRDKLNSDSFITGMIVWPDNLSGTWYYNAVQEATNSHDYVYGSDGFEKWTKTNVPRDWAALEK